MPSFRHAISISRYCQLSFSPPLHSLFLIRHYMLRFIDFQELTFTPLPPLFIFFFRFHFISHFAFISMLAHYCIDFAFTPDTPPPFHAATPITPPF
jgi:hypothetical protein